MHWFLRSALASSLLACLAAVPAAAQPDPTPDDIQQLRAKFDAEREQALKAKYPAESLAKADELAKRAEAAKADNPRAAARHLRDARWQLPYLPPGLPPHVSRVLGESRLRHADRVNALAYSPNGQLVASASRDFTIKVWDMGNGREVATYRGHVDQPDDPTRGDPTKPAPTGTNVLNAADVAFHPKEAVVASACGNQVHMWEPTTGKAIKTLVNLGKTDKPVKAIAFSPDGRLLAVGADDGVLRVVETETGKAVLTSNPRNARIERVTFSPNGKLVAVCDTAAQLAVYPAAGPNNQPVMSVRADDVGELMGVCFAADGAALFTGGRDGKARLTAGPNPDGGNAPNTATNLRLFAGHGGPVNAVAATADGKFLVTSSDDKSVRVWDVGTAKPVRSFQGHLTKVTAVAVRGDGRQLVSGSEDGAIRVWDLSPTDDHRAITDARESLWAVAVSPDGKRVAAAGADRQIRLYAADTGKLEATIDAGAAMTALAFLPDGNRLVAAGGDRVVKVWDVAAKKVARELTGHALAVLAVACSDDGKVVVSGSADASVRGFDPKSGKELWKWASRKPACAVAVRKGGKQVAVGLADGGLAVLDVTAATPRELASVPAHTSGTTALAYSPDGERLASVGGDGVVRVWAAGEGGTLAPLARFEGQTRPGPGAGTAPLSAVAFAPDGRFVAAAGAEGVVRVWDVQTKGEVRGLRGHTDWVTSVAFAPDGRFLAAVAAEKDNALRLFELPALDTTGAGGHLLGLNAVAVSPDGRQVATAGTDQTVKVWNLATGREAGTLIGNEDTPFAVAFLGNDALAVGSSVPNRTSGGLSVWGTAPPRLRAGAKTGEVYTLVAASDGTKVAAWSARPAVGDMYKNSAYEVYDAKGEKLVTVPDLGRNVRAATFTPDLSWAVAGDKTGTVRIFDLTRKPGADEKPVPVGGDWALLDKEFLDLGITPDKRLLVAGDVEGTVKVADVARRATLAEVRAHDGNLRGVVVSPTGTTFATLGGDRTVKVWSLKDVKDGKVEELRSWALPVGLNGAAYTPDGKGLVTANADGTAYVLELP